MMKVFSIEYQGSSKYLLENIKLNEGIFCSLMYKIVMNEIVGCDCE